MTTNQNGAIAETAIAHAATKLRIDVYRPVAEGGRYDLIFVVAERLLRVQRKWAARRDNVLVVPCVSSWRSRDGFVRRPYTAARSTLLRPTPWTLIAATSCRSSVLKVARRLRFDWCRRATTKSGE